MDRLRAATKSDHVESPVSIEQVGQRTRSFDWLSASGQALHWVESVPSRGGSVVGTWTQARGLQLGTVDVGNSVHAYGGGPYAASSGGIWTTTAADGQIWLNDKIQYTRDQRQHGDLVFNDGLLLAVRESSDRDQLIAINPATHRTQVIHEASFIASPRLNRGRLTWMQWGSAVMPWDSAEVWVADYDPAGSLTRMKLIAGGPDESASQPRWGPDGHLYFMSDRSGWWNLYRTAGQAIVPVAAMQAECAPAPWELGYSTYAFLPQGRLAVITQVGPESRLALVAGDGTWHDLPTPYTSLKPYLAAADDRLSVIGSAPAISQQIALVPTSGTDQIEVVRHSNEDPQAVSCVSVPEEISVPSGGADVTVIFYPAQGIGPRRPTPVIVRAHAGPTYQAEIRLDWEVQFFTSRGFAVADVDYRGSTGYGRTYRKALDGRWGELDVIDCQNAARHLIHTGCAMPTAIFITGASAGGYTALKAVCTPDTPFALAVARSAIINPGDWITTAPRFQRPHAAILSHPNADVTPDEVCRPVAMIHGGADTVAPAADAVDLAASLKSRGLLANLVVLPDVGHYLRSPQAIKAALDAELAAYRTVLTDLGL
ncbi:S9 family peptidase [Catellatospora chokoriensis]|nr:prolyl oligopeptidase family serine peptidase [Catellatospora chokoriensis]